MRSVSTSDAPPEEQAYSHATVAKGFVFTAGQIPVTPDGEMITENVTAMTEQCLDNLEAILAEAGASLDDVVKTTAYFTDVDDFAEMDAAYETYFESDYPARDVVEVADLPEGAEMELVMVAATHDDN